MRRKGERLPHGRTRISQCMVAHRNRHRGKLAARCAVEMHVALHGDRGAARRRGEAIGRRLTMGAPFFAVTFDVTGTAEEPALAREAHGGHPPRNVRKAGRNPKRPSLAWGGGAPPRPPRLVSLAD